MTEKITVHLPVWTEYAVTVEIDDEALAEEDFDAVIEEAYENLPSGLCHGCTTGNSGVGWGQPSPVYLEIGDDPEPQYITNENGDVIWGDPFKKMGW